MLVVDLRDGINKSNLPLKNDQHIEEECSIFTWHFCLYLVYGRFRDILQSLCSSSIWEISCFPDVGRYTVFAVSSFSEPASEMHARAAPAIVPV